MGLFDSSSSQTTSIPGMSAMERKLQNLFMEGFLPQMMEESGFKLIKGELSEAEQKEMAGYKKLPIKNVKVAARMAELNAKTEKMSLQKIYSPDIEDLREEFGADSDQFKSAVKEFEGKKFKSEEMQRDLVTTFQQNTKKFLEGDFSMSDAQKKSINEMFSTEREILGMGGFFDEGQSSDQINGKMDRIGGSYESTQRKLLEMGIEDAGNQITNKVMSQAVASGRDPSDPEFVAQIGEMVSREATRGGLALETDLMNRRMDLAGQARDLRIGSMTGGGGMTAQSAQLQDAIANQRIMNLNNLNANVSGQAGGMRQERMSQQTTTGTSTPSLGSTLLGIGTAAASGYAGYQAGNRYSAQADYYSAQADKLRAGST